MAEQAVDIATGSEIASKTKFPVSVHESIFPKADKIRSALTPSQKRIASLMASGTATPQIATDLSISQKTVDRHITELYERTGIHSQKEFYVAAYKADIIDPDAVFLSFNTKYQELQTQFASLEGSNEMSLLQTVMRYPALTDKELVNLMEIPDKQFEARRSNLLSSLGKSQLADVMLIYLACAKKEAGSPIRLLATEPLVNLEDIKRREEREQVFIGDREEVLNDINSYLAKEVSPEQINRIQQLLTYKTHYETIELLLRGNRGTAEMARELSIADKTFKNRTTAIYKSLGIEDRRQLYFVAYAADILHPPGIFKRQGITYDEFQARLSRLTPRQREVFAEYIISSNGSKPLIAEQLSRSLNTINTHANGILEKLGTQTMVDSLLLFLAAKKMEQQEQQLPMAAD